MCGFIDGKCPENVKILTDLTENLNGLQNN